MEIHILRAGKQEGPFAEEDVQRLLRTGAVLIGDLAWRPGLGEWAPLHAVLYPAPGAVAAPAAAVPAEPPTAKQQAFMAYLGIPVPPGASRESAAVLINDHVTDAKYSAQVARWAEEKLRLHPELFAEELHARKEGRVQHYFEVCQKEGAGVVAGVTRAHCQVLIAYLDVSHPRWDAHSQDAAWSYFFPAVAEKFPQLVSKDWKDKLHFPTGRKVAPELYRPSSPRATKPLKQAAPSPLAAVARGLIFGLLLLALAGGALFLVKRPAVVERLKREWAGAWSPAPAREAAAAVAPTPPPNPEIATSTSAPSPAETTASAAPGTTEPTKPAETTEAESASAAAPQAPRPPPTPAASPLSAARDTVVLRKATRVQSPYGPITIPSGTPLRVVATEGPMLQVSFQNQLYLVAASSTDIAEGL